MFLIEQEKKERRRESKRRYRELNSEKIRAYNRRYHLAHRDEHLQKMKAYQKLNPEKYKEYNRKSNLKHRDKRLAYSKEYRKNNRERLNATSRKWQREHPEKIKARTSLKGKIICNLVNPRSNTCSKCGKKYPDELTRQTCMHHEQYDDKDPLAHTIELCHSCHGKLHAKIKYPGPHYKKGTPEYYQKHREKLLANQHRYNEKHRDKQKEHSKKQYQNNRGFILARSQAIRDSTKEAHENNYAS